MRRELDEENNRPITTSEAYRRAGFDAEAWSLLGHQVVGGELPPGQIVDREYVARRGN